MRRWNVASYRDGDVLATLADVSVPLAAAPEKEPEDLELPPGIVDPRAKLAEIYSKRSKRAA
jgi:hypothetical protein